MSFGTGVTALSPDTSQELSATLELVVDAIVEALGFEVVVVNLIDPRDDSIVVAAVRGPEEAERALLDRREARKAWDLLLAQSQAWGRLHFLDHRLAVGDPDDMFIWRPQLPVSDDPEAWHPDDALFAVLYGSGGEHLGILSVDVPADGKRPGPVVRRALEAFAVTASLAIENAQLVAEQAVLLGHFQAVFDASPVAISVLDRQRRLLRVNAAYCTFLGRTQAEVLGHDPLEFTHPEDLQVGILDPSRPLCEQPGGRTVEKRYVRPDGRVVWGRLHLATLGDSRTAAAVLAQIEDVTDRKDAELRLLRQAHYDALTGLPNRVHAMQALHAALAAVPRSGVAVFFCDLDRLKLVNDAHGHAVGDAYLQQVSRRIAESVRLGDVVGRLSGDEFVVIAPDLAPTAAVALAERLVTTVHAPLRLAGLDFTPSLSIGIAVSDGGVDVSTADELLARADAAMYDAKVQDRGSWHLHTGGTRHSAAEQLQLRAEIGRALAEEEFVLHYQPIVSLPDGVAQGHEALLRWDHPRRGLLAPGQFLDVITGSEFETPVTDWVIGRACLDAARRPVGERRVSVNVSSVQVCRADLADVVTAALHRSGLAPEGLVLELTEDRLLSRPDGDVLLRRLRALGVTLAVDDYGTGYAGLSYLERFDAVGVLKLDRSFTASLGVKPVSEHVVRSVVALARDCGLLLVAEGIETPEQAALLTACGVRLGQGYLFGSPVPFTGAAVAGD